MMRWMVLAVLASSGCIPLVPHYSPQYPTRSNVESRLESFPIAEKTRREDVLLRLGEPDGTSNHQRIFIYRWTKVIGFIPGYYASVPIPRDTVLTIEFDEEGVVKKVESQGRFGSGF